MSSTITIMGEQLIARYLGSEETLVIDRFILANVDGLDPEAAVDREEQRPDAGDIVYTYDIPDEYKGYVNDNQVVYSMLLGSNLGDFEFNWVGLYSSADDVVVAITHVPVTGKWQTDTSTGTLGNNLTRNFLLEFTGAQACTGITVTAATWQIDFTVRLAGMDERERRSNRDIYGRSCFWGDGWKVVNSAGTYTLTTGTGYIEGIRVALAADEVITPGTLPKNVWLDVSLQASGADVVTVVIPVFSTIARADYTDGNNIDHYLEKIAEIDAAGVVTDVRRTEPIAADVIGYMTDMVTAEADARASADDVLQDNIDAEAQARAAAISAEVSARTAADIESGTVMIFGQPSAPTGWTKITSWTNNAMLMFHSGSSGGSGGGSVNPHSWTTAVSVANHSNHNHGTSSLTLSVAQTPAHVHRTRGRSDIFNQPVSGSGRYSIESNYSLITSNIIGSTGGSGSHGHGNTGYVLQSGAYTHTVGQSTYSPRYRLVIAATKN